VSHQQVQAQNGCISHSLLSGAVAKLHAEKPCIFFEPRDAYITKVSQTIRMHLAKFRDLKLSESAAEVVRLRAITDTPTSYRASTIIVRITFCRTNARVSHYLRFSVWYVESDSDIWYSRLRLPRALQHFLWVRGEPLRMV